MAQQQELSILEFKTKYGSEDACREHLSKTNGQKVLYVKSADVLNIITLQLEKVMNVKVAIIKHL